MSDHSELRSKASAATEGPWWAEAVGAPSMGGGNPGGYQVVAQRWRIARTQYGSDDGRDNAAYIAAASPEVVLGLLDELDRLRSENDQMRAWMADSSNLERGGFVGDEHGIRCAAASEEPTP